MGALSKEEREESRGRWIREDMCMRRDERVRKHAHRVS
jgi:hypothetical protein